MRGATSITLPNLTKYCACHAKWLSWLIFVTYETSITKRGATGITLQPHQILRLPRKSALQNLSKILRERLKRQFQCAADSTMIRTWSDHDPSMNSSSRTRPFVEVTFRASETHFVLKITTFRAPAIYSNFTEYCACHENPKLLIRPKTKLPVQKLNSHPWSRPFWQSENKTGSSDSGLAGLFSIFPKQSGRSSFELAAKIQSSRFFDQNFQNWSSQMVF